MNKLILTIVILLTLSGCNKKPVEEDTSITHTDLADLTAPTTTDHNAKTSHESMDEAEAAAIAHDSYDPDSIYDGGDNTAIPPPQLKRRLAHGETIEASFKPVGFTRTFQVNAVTVYDSTRLSIVSETDDVIEKMEINHGDCQISSIEPYTTKFPIRVIYATKFNLILKNCRADQIKDVDLYTTYGKLPYTLIEE